MIKGLYKLGDEGRRDMWWRLKKESAWEGMVVLALFFGTVVIPCVDFRMEAEGGVSEPRWRNQGWRTKRPDSRTMSVMSQAQRTRGVRRVIVFSRGQIGHLVKNKGITTTWWMCVQCGARVVRPKLSVTWNTKWL